MYNLLKAVNKWRSFCFGSFSQTLMSAAYGAKKKDIYNHNTLATKKNQTIENHNN